MRQAGAAKRFAAGPIGLVERCLEDERDAEVGAECDEVLRDGDGERVGFEHARPGDEEEAFRGRRRRIFFHGRSKEPTRGAIQMRTSINGSNALLDRG